MGDVFQAIGNRARLERSPRWLHRPGLLAPILDSGVDQNLGNPKMERKQGLQPAVHILVV